MKTVMDPEWYWRFVPSEELEGRDADELREVVDLHTEYARTRAPGETLLRVRQVEGDTPHSVIEVVSDDMPFLVDSTAAELMRLDVPIHLFVHPQPHVHRDEKNVLTEVIGVTGPASLAPGECVESWMRIEVDVLDTPERVEEVIQNLERVLNDVRLAVGDWEPMRVRALHIADELATSDLPVPDKYIEDTRELLQWLVDDNFTFLGYREYRLVGDGKRESLELVPGTGLGILSREDGEPRSVTQMPSMLREYLKQPRLLIVTKANSRATVHTPAYMDYIGIKVFNDAGQVVGEKRFLGLFTSTAYSERVRNVPAVSRKVNEVIERSGLDLRSHSGRDLLHVLETYPRDELFQVRTDELYDTVMEILQLSGRREMRVFVRPDLYGRFISCLVYLPRDRYTTQARIRMQEILMEEFNGVGVHYTASVSESRHATVRFVVRVGSDAEFYDIDSMRLRKKFAEVTRLWSEEYAQLLQEWQNSLEEPQSVSRYLRYANAFSDAYKAERSPAAAVKDVKYLESLNNAGYVAVSLTSGESAEDDTLSFTIYHRGGAMTLSAVLPLLQSFGVKVLDERPYTLSFDGEDYAIYEYTLLLASGAEEHVDVPALAPAVEDTFVACWCGDAEVDSLNALVLTAGLTWDEVVILRAYTRYLRQAGFRFSQGYTEKALTAHPSLARNLVHLFRTRFDPEFSEERTVAEVQVLDEIDAMLEDVSSLDHDTIVRAFLSVITATLRTNHYQRRGDGQLKQYTSLKIDAPTVELLPLPRPKFEIFVYSARMEGVHMRFGPVARGGLRWSDRHEDFRTEILGLVKAQMVKNSIIVPTGSKGGFVCKRLPDGASREERQQEGIECYRMFISGLLDITDNRGEDGVEHPERVVRHDSDDPYLVVAADKGTATFSDIANGISAEYNFWLGDAFASGGSIGYDHKKMGITARGAWESVKRHFREIGVDTQTTEFTVAGIGDMSGDVFGNGMLLSEKIRLVAAFDHRHIFIDPNPDAATSFEERKRLFELPVSTWDSYDRELISAGGGVFSRSVKSVPLTPEIRRALGIEDDVQEMVPSELISAILTAPVDLLWNGGIGTYVKASSETNAEVGDKANDLLRVNGAQLRCTVVGEGGNLGFTQEARIEYALTGGRINTDAIDNCGGVDTSDHEVNMKILFRQAIATGLLGGAERDAVLMDMTDEVAQLVLRDCYEQNTALMISNELSPKLISVHSRLMNSLERSGLLNRSLEFLPDEEEVTRRQNIGTGLTQPELAVLLSYEKIALKDKLLASDLPDDPWCTPVLVNYFPAPMREKYQEQMEKHPLAREIVATVLTNEIINFGGVTFIHRAMEETGASGVDVARAYLVMRGVFGLPSLWEQASQLDHVVSTQVQATVYARLRRVLDRGVRWLLQRRGQRIDVASEIENLRPGVAELLPDIAALQRDQERDRLKASAGTLVKKGIPSQFAQEVTGVLFGFVLLDVVELAAKAKISLLNTAKVYFTVSEHFGLDELLSAITRMPRDDRWSALARMAVRYELYGVMAGITEAVLEKSGGPESAQELVDAWFEENSVRVARIDATVAMLKEANRFDLAALTVLLRQMRSLLVSA